jgi:hypothetical protein
MITIEQLNKMINLVVKSQQGSSHPETICARCDIPTFCRIIHKKVPDYPGDIVDDIFEVQQYVDEHITNGRRLVFGFSDIDNKVHWHVVKDNHWLYYSRGYPHLATKECH